MLTGFLPHCQQWDKTSVTRTIYDNLSQAGSRFLKYKDALKIWEEISPMAARDKIGHGRCRWQLSRNLPCNPSFPHLLRYSLPRLALRFANRVTRRKRNADCIGNKAILPAIITPAATATAAPQPVQVSQSSPFPSLPVRPLDTKPLNIQQLPPLGCITTEVRSVPQLLQVLGVSTGPAAPSTSPAPAPSAPSSTLSQLQQPGMLAQTTFAPLERSEKWYQEKIDALKIKAKPAPPAATPIPAAAPTTAISPAAVSFDDSFSILDDIFPLLQNAQDPCLSADVADGNLEIDFDFDAEIMSVLF